MMCTVDAAVVCRLGQVPLAAPMSHWLVRISSDHFFNELLSAFDLSGFQRIGVNNKGGRFTVRSNRKNYKHLGTIPTLVYPASSTRLVRSRRNAMFDLAVLFPTARFC